jgi:hypothetical protein
MRRTVVVAKKSSNGRTKGQGKNVTFNVTTPLSGFQRNMYFNRFRVEKQGNGKLVDFAFVRKGQVLDHFSSFISNVDLANNRQRLETYIQQTPTELEDPEAEGEFPNVTPHCVVSFRMIQASRADDSAELLLINFPLFLLVTQRDQVPEPSVQADPVAMLSTSLPIQRRFLLELLMGES